MEDATMIKREYEKPMMQVIKIDVRQQILAGSITGVTSTGLDAEEELILSGEGLPKSGSVWDDAW